MSRLPRILICEDSRAYAAALRRALEHEASLEVVGVSRSGEEALAAVPNVRPDLVTMDLELPGMSGMQAVEQIMSRHPVPILVLSSRVGPGSDRAAAALAAGALDAIGKTDLDLADPAGPSASALRRRLALLSGAKVIRHPRANLNGNRPVPNGNVRVRTARVIGICASTGGPNAIAAVLDSLPASFAVPLLVVQHMSAGFTEGFVKWLDENTRLPVRIAQPGIPLQPGVWVAPEDAHLVLDGRHRLAVDRHQEALHRPSADVLLRSLAEHARRGTVSVVLTGMGRDGAAGSRAVREAGGFTIAQDEASSAVFGMPKAAAESGVDLVLPLDRIGAQLGALVAMEVTP